VTRRPSQKWAATRRHVRETLCRPDIAQHVVAVRGRHEALAGEVREVLEQKLVALGVEPYAAPLRGEQTWRLATGVEAGDLAGAIARPWRLTGLQFPGNGVFVRRGLGLTTQERRGQAPYLRAVAARGASLVASAQRPGTDVGEALCHRHRTQWAGARAD
jgi:hypothetical protein